MQQKTLDSIPLPNLYTLPMDGFFGNNGSQNGCAAKMTPLDPEELRRQGHIMVDFIADYYKNVEKYPVRSQVEPGYLREHLPRSAPYSPETMESILKDVKDHIVPGLTHWQSPNHFAYYQANTSTAGFLGEMLCTGFNVVGFSWISSPAATELENIVMDWLGDMVSLPKSFLFSGGGGGAIHTSTCEAILCTIVTARDQMLSKIGRENAAKLVVYGSDQTHSAFPKAAKIAGIEPSNIRSILTTKSTEYSLSPSSLKEQILKDLDAGLVPLFLCANVGTTSTSAVDPLGPICDIAKDHGIWVHVDAAYAGSACICPEFRQVIDGVEGADSFSFNAHKWLFSCMDSCCVWLKNPSVLVQTLSAEFECLNYKVANNNNGSNQVVVPVDYKDWQIALSRRFRALKLWMVLRYYGVSNLRSFIRKHVDMARHFEKLVNMDKRFEVVAPVDFSLVCFRVSPSVFGPTPHRHDQEYVNKFNSDLLEAINATGKVFMIHAVVEGIYTIRFAVGATLAEYRHIDMAWKVVQEHADSMLEAYFKNLSF